MANDDIFDDMEEDLDEAQEQARDTVDQFEQESQEDDWFDCDYCSAVRESYDELERHIQEQHPQHAQGSDRTYYDSDARQSAEGGNYSCDMCGRAFQTTTQLRQHKQSQHGEGEVTDEEWAAVHDKHVVEQNRRWDESQDMTQYMAGERSSFSLPDITLPRAIGLLVGMILISILFLYVSQAMLVLVAIVGLWGFYAGFGADSYDAFHDLEALFMVVIFILTASNAVLSILAGRFLEISVITYLFTGIGTGIYLFVGGHYQNARRALKTFEPHGKESPVLILGAQLILAGMLFLGGGLIGIPFITEEGFFTVAAIAIGVLSPMSLFIMFNPKHRYAQQAVQGTANRARQGVAKAQNVRSKRKAKSLAQDLDSYIREVEWGTDRMLLHAEDVYKYVDQGQIQQAQSALDDLSRETNNEDQVNQLVAQIRNQLNAMEGR